MAKSKRRKGPKGPVEVGRSMCRHLGCDFECDDPYCVICPKCGHYCRAIFFPFGAARGEADVAERAEILEAWRRGEIAPWPELMLACQAESMVAPGGLQ